MSSSALIRHMQRSGTTPDILLHASLYVPVYSTRSCNSLLTRFPFATKPCGLSNVLQRFKAPIIDPLPQPPVVERSRENEAAYGEQIQQECHRVEQCSDRAEALATLHPVCWSSSEKRWHILR
jgi:hypothetical protein